ncbi:alpha/beta hydrolase family protein [Pseudomonas mosselii]|uniref:Dienelactone hydrolase n=1 Tax=Pseudomonas mosselii TaxID=78327 RepID=A0ABX9AT03_9PSED|nr:dienelactone hydrolase [Pseudomonas mosselii]MBH3312664.1 dienelactone hydrolase [Pseudomonas mosselii]MBH3325813.1 dienelactone hydrolase [Pseudomonas mosselii]MCL8302731.1 dienelactone hydrolase [Pseudomonas mosselii]MCL8341441.1 dienelactone hydrolase [Pseudomonas mosselii]MCU9527852.1 dienelactone hydrolase [Pseudomonas mosselii]
MKRTRMLMALLLLGGLLARADAAPWVAGLHRLTLTDPVDARPMQALVFYPSSGEARPVRIEGYQTRVAEEAPVAMGQFPLLVISHGNTGSPMALHDLANGLARQGFVVVAVVHPGDNNRDHSRLGTLSNLYGRPLQISAAITAARNDRLLAPYLNDGKVGVIGYSAGGETALILSGARPDLERLRRYCEQRPTDTDACKTHGVLIADHSELAPRADPRVGAVMLMAPLSLMFGRHALAGVQVPALIYSGDNDQLLVLEHNADALARKLPVTPDYRLLAGAGHFVFMAPCDDEQHQRMPVLCKDAEGVDRQHIHRSLRSETTAFFSQALGAPEPAERSAAAGQQQGQAHP